MVVFPPSCVIGSVLLTPPRLYREFSPQLLRCIVLVFALSARLSAEEWTAATSPTTETLWGVAYGANTYVAVGEHGTLLTSSDAATWQLGHSGTSQWLLSVAWSPTLRLFVAVGDAGTVLTSTDTVTWSPRQSRTSQRLNAVAWGGGVFLAVGEAGTALTSPDGITWMPRTTGDTGWLRGLAYGNGRFVVSGHDGTILTTADAGASFQRQLIATHEGLTALTFAEDHFIVYWAGPSYATSTDGTFWSISRGYSRSTVGLAAATAAGSTSLAAGDTGFTSAGTVSTPASSNWLGATSSADKFVLVGSGGSIAVAPFAIASSPAVSVEVALNGRPATTARARYQGDDVTLHASCRGAQPASWQWYFNDQPVPTQTSADLSLASISAAHAGTYTSVVTTATGEILRGSFTLTLAPDTPTRGLVDKTYQPPLPTVPSAVAALPDGRLYVAARDVFFDFGDHARLGLARLLADGSLDPAFDPGWAIDYDDRITDLIVQPDGQVVVRATKTLSTGATSSRLIRLHADGTVDASFLPDATLRDSPSRPILLTDGCWLIATPTTDGAGNRTLTVSRFRADGSADVAFTPISAAFAATTTSSDATLSHTIVSTVDASGRVYVATRYGFIHYSGVLGSRSGQSLLFRLNADGSPDLSFPIRSFDEIQFLGATTRGLLVQSASYATNLSGYAQTSLFRLHLDGTDDPSFVPIAGGNPLVAYSSGYANHRKIALLADDSIVAQENTIHTGLVRFTADGIRDADFSADHDLAGLASNLVPLADGRVLIVTADRLLRLNPERHGGRTRLTNLSVRAAQSSGEAGLIVGVVVQGGPKQILARAIGPSLADYQVTDWLPDPQLKLVHAGATLLANDDWAESGSVYLAKTFARLGAFSLIPGSHDAAAVGIIPAGPNTIEITDAAGATGIVLGEIYDGDDAPANASSPRLINLSARARTGTGNDSLIVGFTVDGDNVRRFLLRAVGAPLSIFGVPQPLADPLLTLCRADGSTVTTATDFSKRIDHWVTAQNCATNVGAFALPSSVGSAQIAISLPAGNYSAVVSSASGSTGIVLLEIYEVP